MIRKIQLKDTDKNKYYHVVYVEDDTNHNIWLTKGKMGIIHLGTVERPEKPRFQHLVALWETSPCEVRDATDEEINWMVGCLAMGTLIDKPSLQYHIF